MASRARVRAFSFTSSCSRAASHSFADTTFSFMTNLFVIKLIADTDRHLPTRHYAFAPARLKWRQSLAPVSDVASVLVAGALADDAGDHATARRAAAAR